MSVKGFKASAVASGMRYKDRLDLALLIAEGDPTTTGLFTTNICKAAPVIWSKQRLGRAKAILVNAGQANAQTGKEGMVACRKSAAAAAELLKIEPDQVLLASTGIIGQPLNIPAMEEALPNLVNSASKDGLDLFAKAIMTTDTFPKTCEIKCAGPDRSSYTIWGAAKGSGMIAPNMATMLCFVLTDAQAPKGFLQSALKNAVEESLNRVTIDGDTSTNDSIFIMASGAAKNAHISRDKTKREFEKSLSKVLSNLARMIAKDGEGANHMIEIAVIGAKNRLEAQQAAKTVAESPLVKTAFFGQDANWGRILMALGRSGAIFDPYRVELDLDDVPWVRGGQDNGQEKAVTAVMAKPEFRLTINLKAGVAKYSMLTCDLSIDYVKINGSYRS
ncbi:MAG: bifunctional glutamate N-acetyltransferase/amino-acid acetyltransferase ArgJ [Deltaproteobacteria bacterium]|jgi:glutamate N-acetyltransferase/amino-acid N-acetyltransferase|nr:bifunctional glutamate N-acetyltransferase/amino-acid acetyltransferase ArgJ [Deltaproteobacteria bacterium]